MVLYGYINTSVLLVLLVNILNGLLLSVPHNYKHPIHVIALTIYRLVVVYLTLARPCVYRLDHLHLVSVSNVALSLVMPAMILVMRIAVMVPVAIKMARMVLEINLVKLVVLLMVYLYVLHLQAVRV